MSFGQEMKDFAAAYKVTSDDANKRRQLDIYEKQGQDRLDLAKTQTEQARLERAGYRNPGEEQEAQRIGKTADAAGGVGEDSIFATKPYDPTDPMDVISMLEAKGRNIHQNVVPEGGGYNPSVGKVTGPSSAQGYFQITVPTWREFAGAAGVDLKQYPTPLSGAPYEVQRKVAEAIFKKEGFNRWAPYNADLRAHIARYGGAQAFKLKPPPDVQTAAASPPAAAPAGVQPAIPTTPPTSPIPTFARAQTPSPDLQTPAPPPSAELLNSGATMAQTQPAIPGDQPLMTDASLERPSLYKFRRGGLVVDAYADGGPVDPNYGSGRSFTQAVTPTPAQPQVQSGPGGGTPITGGNPAGGTVNPGGGLPAGTVGGRTPIPGGALERWMAAKAAQPAAAPPAAPPAPDRMASQYGDPNAARFGANPASPGFNPAPAGSNAGRVAGGMAGMDQWDDPRVYQTALMSSPNPQMDQYYQWRLGQTGWNNIMQQRAALMSGRPDMYGFGGAGSTGGGGGDVGTNSGAVGTGTSGLYAQGGKVEPAIPSYADGGAVDDYPTEQAYQPDQQTPNQDDSGDPGMSEALSTAQRIDARQAPPEALSAMSARSDMLTAEEARVHLADYEKKYRQLKRAERKARSPGGQDEGDKRKTEGPPEDQRRAKDAEDYQREPTPPEGRKDESVRALEGPPDQKLAKAPEDYQRAVPTTPQRVSGAVDSGTIEPAIPTGPGVQAMQGPPPTTPAPTGPGVQAMQGPTEEEPQEPVEPPAAAVVGRGVGRGAIVRVPEGPHGVGRGRIVARVPGAAEAAIPPGPAAGVPLPGPGGQQELTGPENPPPPPERPAGVVPTARPAPPALAGRPAAPAPRTASPAGRPVRPAIPTGAEPRAPTAAPTAGGDPYADLPGRPEGNINIKQALSDRAASDAQAAKARPDPSTPQPHQIPVQVPVLQKVLKLAADGLTRKVAQTAPGTPAIPAGGASTAHPVLTANAGAPSSEDVEAGIRAIDPDGKLTRHEQMVQLMQNATMYYASHGNMPKAQEFATSMLLFSRKIMQQSGLVAQAALEHGDVAGAARIMQKGYDNMPDGKAISFKVNPDNTVSYRTMQPDNSVGPEIKAGPDELMVLAKQMSNGGSWMEALMAGVSGGRGGGRQAGPPKVDKPSAGERKEARQEAKTAAQQAQEEAATPPDERQDLPTDRAYRARREKNKRTAQRPLIDTAIADVPEAIRNDVGGLAEDIQMGMPGMTGTQAGQIAAALTSPKGGKPVQDPRDLSFKLPGGSKFFMTFEMATRANQLKEQQAKTGSANG